MNSAQLCAFQMENPNAKNVRQHHFARQEYKEKIQELPVKEKAKARRIEKKTVLILRDEDKIAICKRPAKGLLAGLYELPNIERTLEQKEITQYCKEIGLMPIHIKNCPQQNTFSATSNGR